jgi:hypothetical protein
LRRRSRIPCERTFPLGFSTALAKPYAWVEEPDLAGTEPAIDDLDAKARILGEPLGLIVPVDPAELAPHSRRRR